MQGWEYKMKVPHRKFMDINGFRNDSLDVKVSLPNDDKLSRLTMEMNNVHNKYIVDLLNEKRDRVLRSYIIESDKKLVFPYLKASLRKFFSTSSMTGRMCSTFRKWRK